MMKLQIQQTNGEWSTLNTCDATGLPPIEKDRLVDQLKRLRDGWVATVFPTGVYQIVAKGRYQKWVVIS